MLRFNKFGIIMLLLFRGISIHLMLRFNEVAWRECVAINTISIHLMLRFNQLSKPPPKYKKQISIHLMLRFNGLVNFILDKYIEFQYILCCGSTPWKNIDGKYIDIFQYILCCGSTLCGRKSVVQGKSVDLGCRRVINKKVRINI